MENYLVIVLNVQLFKQSYIFRFYNVLKYVIS